MSFDDIAQSLERLDVEPGDIVLVTVAGDVSFEAVAAYAEGWRKLLPGVQALIVTEGTTLQMLNDDVLAAHGLMRIPK